MTSTPDPIVPQGERASVPRKALAQMGRSLRNASNAIAGAFQWLTRDPLLKTITLFAAIIFAALVAVAIALTLRFVSPHSQVTVSTFEVFPPGQQDSVPAGKVLADFVVDSMHTILEQASTFSGNAYSSKKSYKAIPDMPQIPVDTSYGSEIKGVSLDQLLATWAHIRYHEFQVSGDLISTPDATPVITMRYTTAGRAKSFEKPLPHMDSSTVKQTVLTLTLEMIKDINPEAAARYLASQAYACQTDCGKSWDPAIQFCWKWTKSNPENAQAQFYLGYTLGHAGRGADALVFLDRALQLDPGLDAAWNFKGGLLIDRGDFEDAKSALQAALRVRKTPNPLMNLGIIAVRQARYREAESYYRQAAAQDPEDVGAWMNLGTALLYLSKNANAAEAYRHAFYLQPGNSSALQALAFSLAREGQTDEALRECELAAGLDPDDGGPLLVEGIVFLGDKQADRAIEQFKAAIGKTNPFEAHVQLGIAYLIQGDLDSASAKFRQILSAFPRNPAAHFFLSKVLEAQGNLPDSQSEASTSEQEFPGFKNSSLDVLEYQDLCCTASAPAPAGASK
jgi:tetratricopeptide (TPR) repeat protein